MGRLLCLRIIPGALKRTETCLHSYTPVSAVSHQFSLSSRGTRDLPDVDEYEAVMALDSQWWFATVSAGSDVRWIPRSSE